MEDNKNYEEKLRKQTNRLRISLYFIIFTYCLLIIHDLLSSMLFSILIYSEDEK